MEERRKPGWPKGKRRGRKVREVEKLKVVVASVGPTFPSEELIADAAERPPFRSNPLQLDVDITTLGTRTETRMVEKVVVVGRTDLGKDVITMKMLPETVTKLQPILNLEETMSLGKRDWQLFPPKEGHWFCKVEQKGQHRRFLIPDEIYQKVKDA